MGWRASSDGAGSRGLPDQSAGIVSRFDRPRQRALALPRYPLLVVAVKQCLPPVRPDHRPEHSPEHSTIYRYGERPVVVLVLGAHDVVLLGARLRRVEDDRVERAPPRRRPGRRSWRHAAPDSRARRCRARRASGGATVGEGAGAARAGRPPRRRRRVACCAPALWNAVASSTAIARPARADRTTRSRIVVDGNHVLPM